jgi:hypothetical protein
LLLSFFPDLNIGVRLKDNREEQNGGCQLLAAQSGKEQEKNVDHLSIAILILLSLLQEAFYILDDALLLLIILQIGLHAISCLIKPFHQSQSHIIFPHMLTHVIQHGNPLS